MHKHLIALGIWIVAALMLAGVYWWSAPGSSAAQVDGSAEATVANAEHGRALFMAKGCTTCHAHAAVAGANSYNIGPNLTSYRADPVFLQRWLRNPQEVRPAAQMPNLNLTQEEIAGLIVFLLADGERP